MHADMERALSSTEWLSCLETVLFPLLATLLLPPRSGSDTGLVDEIRMRTCNLLTKVPYIDDINVIC